MNLLSSLGIPSVYLWNQCYLITHHPVLSLVLMCCLLHIFVQICTSYTQRWILRKSIKLKIFNEKIETLTEKHSNEPEILKEKKMDLIFKFKIFPLFTPLLLVVRLFGFIGITAIVAFSQLMVFCFPSDFANYEIIQNSCPTLENNICDETFMFQNWHQKYTSYSREQKTSPYNFDCRIIVLCDLSYRTLDWENPK